MSGSLVPVEWNGRSVDAYVPARLASIGELGTRAIRAAALAEGALTALGEVASGLEVSARLLLRAEGVASSRIEAVDATVDAVAVAGADPRVEGTAAWVADNLRTVDMALSHTGRITVKDLFAWHRLLMVHSGLEEIHVGAWRDRVGWVGGPSPRRAAYVAAPHEMIGELMGDLIAFLNGRSHDPVTQAALAHAQFETIHPFADGNGRIGRILIGWVLRRRLGIQVPPPVSIVLARDVGGYLSGLTRFRNAGPDPWVTWFAGAVEHAATTAGSTLGAVSALASDWPSRVGGLRRDAAARRLLPILLDHPALDTATVAELLDVSEPAARNALTQLAERGILRVADGIARGGQPGRPPQWWVVGELLDLLSQ